MIRSGNNVVSHHPISKNKFVSNYRNFGPRARSHLGGPVGESKDERSASRGYECVYREWCSGHSSRLLESRLYMIGGVRFVAREQGVHSSRQYELG